MNNKLVTFLVAFILLFSYAFAQDDEPYFKRVDPVPVPEPDLNIGGLSSIITNVDLDADGKMDVFISNNMWDNANTIEQTPRLYKYEMGDSGWEIVWACSLTNHKQNSWSALAVADLDGDGLQEIVWGPIESYSISPNPVRLVVYEEVEATLNDDLGVADGDNWKPNAETTILDEDNMRVRPFKFVVEDVDFDDTTEVVFCDRTGSSSTGGWYFGVLSVDKVPDDADGSETWTVEANGKTVGLTDVDNKWDIAYMDSVIYLFDENRIDRVKWNGSEWELLTSQTKALEGAGAWRGAVVADIDGNAKDEIIVGSWYTSVVGGHGIYILEGWDPTGENQLDSLKSTKVVDLSPWMADGAYGVYGGALGDIDGNGKKDFVFGSRNTTPNALIFRAEYQGEQNQVGDANNWTVEVIDSMAVDVDQSGRWDVIAVGNMDDDVAHEVFYSTSIPAGDIFTGEVTQPIFVLDYTAPKKIGPWAKRDPLYVYDGDLISGIGGVHGIAVDKYNRIWVPDWTNGIAVLNAAGDTAFAVDTAWVKTDAGADTALNLLQCRGLAVDKDGNIIFNRAGHVVRLNVEDGSGMEWFPFPSSPAGPAVDGEGYIYISLVVGTNPITVLDPATLDLSGTITLDPAASYTRGMAVSADGLTLYPGDLTDVIHPARIYESTDFINYPYTDSIYTDNTGNPIFNTQTVTVDRDPFGRIWYSVDDSYGGASIYNAMIGFNFETHQYNVVPSPDATKSMGPRGAAWNSTGDTMYVASANGAAVYRYVADPTSVADSKRVPLNFSLSQNYPNPFNPITNIEFTIGSAGKASLTIYNILGQKVTTLFDKEMVPGKYKMAFDASRYASGTYIYELKSNNQVITKKMTLLK